MLLRMSPPAAGRSRRAVPGLSFKGDGDECESQPASVRVRREHLSGRWSFMGDNPYIHGGYRVGLGSWRSALWSLFQMHNETMNVWTHLVGAVLFASLLLYVLFSISDMPLVMHHRAPSDPSASLSPALRSQPLLQRSGAGYNNYTWVLVARGGRERSNPATRKTHSGMGVKETHYINVVGKNTNTNFKAPGSLCT